MSVSSRAWAPAAAQPRTGAHGDLSTSVGAPGRRALTDSLTWSGVPLPDDAR
jgi:hypothetical protein